MNRNASILGVGNIRPRVVVKAGMVMVIGEGLVLGSGLGLDENDARKDAQGDAGPSSDGDVHVEQEEGEENDGDFVKAADKAEGGAVGEGNGAKRGSADGGGEKATGDIGELEAERALGEGVEDVRELATGKGHGEDGDDGEEV